MILINIALQSVITLSVDYLTQGIQKCAGQGLMLLGTTSSPLVQYSENMLRQSPDIRITQGIDMRNGQTALVSGTCTEASASLSCGEAKITRDQALVFSNTECDQTDDLRLLHKFENGRMQDGQWSNGEENLFISSSDDGYLLMFGVDWGTSTMNLQGVGMQATPTSFDCECEVTDQNQSTVLSYSARMNGPDTLEIKDKTQQRK